MPQSILSIAYNYVDEPGHEKHWIVQTEPRQFDLTAEEEIDRQDISLVTQSYTDRVFLVNEGQIIMQSTIQY